MSAGRIKSVFTSIVVVGMAVTLTSCSPEQKVSTNPEAGAFAGPDGKPAPFREPVRLSSKDGVLEVRLSAHQGTVNLDTVKEQVTNFLVYGFRSRQGH